MASPIPALFREILEGGIEAMLQLQAVLHWSMYTPAVCDIKDHLAESLDAAEGAQYEALMDIVVELLLTHESSDCRCLAIAMLRSCKRKANTFFVESSTTFDDGCALSKRLMIVNVQDLWRRYVEVVLLQGLRDENPSNFHNICRLVDEMDRYEGVCGSYLAPSVIDFECEEYRHAILQAARRAGSRWKELRSRHEELGLPVVKMVYHELFVKTLTGNTITLPNVWACPSDGETDLVETDLVETVMCLLEECEGVPVHQQRLIYAGK